jgi:hypothetical protein
MNRIDEGESNQGILLEQNRGGRRLYDDEQQEKLYVDIDPGQTMSDAAVQQMIFDLPTPGGGGGAGGQTEGDDSEAPSDSYMTFGEESAGVAATNKTSTDLDESEKDSRTSASLRLTRAIVLLVTLLVGTFSVGFVFKYTASYEEELFQTEFVDKATRVIDLLLLDTRTKFLMAQQTSIAMTSLLNVHGGPSMMNHVNATISVGSFDEITRVQQKVSFPLAVSWSPFLSTWEERESCEKAVSTERGQQVDMFHLKDGVIARDDSSPVSAQK